MNPAPFDISQFDGFDDYPNDNQIERLREIGYELPEVIHEVLWFIEGKNWDGDGTSFALSWCHRDDIEERLKDAVYTGHSKMFSGLPVYIQGMKLKDSYLEKLNNGV